MGKKEDQLKADLATEFEKAFLHEDIDPEIAEKAGKIAADLVADESGE